MTASTIAYSHAAANTAEPAEHLRVAADSNILRHMRATLYHHIAQHRWPNRGIEPIYARENDGRQHRVILMDGNALRWGDKFAFVGFFGHKRPGIDADTLDNLDRELMAEFVDYPHLLSYSSLEQTDGSWANLVVMSSPEGAMHWARSPRHAYAVQEVAPRCYSTIRLHSGVLAAGNASEAALNISRTKYFEFDGSR